MEEKILIILNTKGNLEEINLSTFHKNQLRIGRDKAVCDIVIPDPIISKTHGEIIFADGKVYYRDNNSTNGTYIENYAKRRLLKKESGYIELLNQSILKIGSVKEPNKMVLILFRMTEASEQWERYHLTQDICTIGRDSKNQIVLKHPGVSKVHCQIVRDANGYNIFDNHSANGIMVNGTTLKNPRKLCDKDVIQILDFQLIYSDTYIYYHSFSRGIQLNAVGINKIVGRGKGKKQILRNVNCEVKGNEFVAIIGGSGAGKSTLMNTISGFDTNFSGNIYCNGTNLVEQFQNLKNIIGYVPQEDIIFENLTLKRMLYYTAKLKMPDDLDSKELEQRIDEVLNMIDLKEHQNTYIRKLSGGQKKRASIAVELLADPKLFFLDEPTSGLDPGTEKNLMQTLKTLAKAQNKTIIMVTHTTQNLHLCDKIIFMGPGGRLCFCGNVEQAKQFFQTDDLVNIYNMLADNPALWESRYAAQSQQNVIPQKVADQTQYSKSKPISVSRQFFILTHRYIELLMNDKPRLLVLLLQPFIIGVLLYIVSDKDIFKIYESTKSMLFALSCSGIWIGLFNSIQEICKERVILKREYMANLKLKSYVLSKVFVQAFLGFVQSVILTFVFLGLVGSDRKGIFVQHFQWEVLLTVWLTIFAAVSLGLVISSIVKSGDKAMAVAPFVLIVQLLFSGILFQLKNAGKYISYFTVSRWSVEGLGSIAKLNRMDLKLQKDFPMIEHEAEAFFKATASHMLKVWGVLALMSILFIIMSIWMLRSLSKDSR